MDPTMDDHRKQGRPSLGRRLLELRARSAFLILFVQRIEYFHAQSLADGNPRAIQEHYRQLNRDTAAFYRKVEDYVVGRKTWR